MIFFYRKSVDNLLEFEVIRKNYDYNYENIHCTHVVNRSFHLWKEKGIDIFFLHFLKECDL